MSLSSPIVLSALRQPEYTGENRCIPCTILNIAITIAIAGILFGVLVSNSVQFGVLSSLLVLVIGLILIYYRGYLIPGTPQITKRFFPERVLRWFDKAPQPDDIEPEYVLRDIGAVEDCDDSEDICLTETFAQTWRNTMASLRDSDTTHEDLASLLDIPADRISFRTHNEAITARVGGNKIGQWESRAALIADVAAAKEFASNGHSLWDSLETDQQGTVLNGLRAFLDQCPSCEGTIDFESDTVRSCCRYVDVVVASCNDCEARIFEVETPDTG